MISSVFGSNGSGSCNTSVLLPAPDCSYRMAFRDFRVDHAGTVQRFLDAVAHILGPDVLLKLSLMHESRRLFPGSAKNEFSSRFVYLVGQALQCLQARWNRSQSYCAILESGSGAGWAGEL